MQSEVPKPFLEIGGNAILWHTIRVFCEVPEVRQVLVATSAGYIDRAREIVSSLGREFAGRVSFHVQEGGPERLHSVHLCAGHLADVDLVAVHDAVRPFVGPEEIRACFDEAWKSGAAILAVPARDTVKVVEHNRITETADRSRLWLAQTPQVFRRQIFLDACEKAIASGINFTDDAAMVEHNGGNVSVVQGSYSNIKITYPQDLQMAETMLGNTRETEFRTGFGYDVHQLTEGRRLILGGVDIPHEKGLLGHSDADVLLHTITDALLGGAALGDLGHFYPDTDQEFKDVDSRLLLRDAVKRVNEAGFAIVNVDATVVAERPKLAPHIAQMKANIAADLSIDIDRISVKATTSEKIGFVGRQEGISAMATVMLKK
ncbi:MAG: 2-C-methyl-D-erythritol 2,4-cyclodiphosphate synthase [Balneolaceae bacterium]|jgi:2-C-methyl-D-erythritol 2,4-cyclodiphosphate synthase/2-C-methyl-D-erythritol 4-phosphate cytidylyltransferase|nr:MAG: 2-C-methyl-D-erythritol 2,4-cyclodiphosphate synthase [Balneolaceae bacterium]